MTTVDVQAIRVWNLANQRAAAVYDQETKDGTGGFRKLGRHSTVRQLPQRRGTRCWFLHHTCDCAECRP